jgi:hypothetical protein
MRYALLIYAEPGYDEALSDAGREAAYAEYFALADDTLASGLRSCSRPRRRPACAWSVAGR